MRQPAMIRISGLHKSFGANQELRGIDLEVDLSQVVVVIGPSGSGKSTLLRCCNGLEIAQRGTIDICGQRLADDGSMLAEKDLNRLRSQWAWCSSRSICFRTSVSCTMSPLGPGRCAG